MQLRQRQIHLDFHTGPAIPDVGVDFDARQFARTMKRAHVNSVTVFAKCHHGHLYYNTKHPARHPSLKPGFDLLAAQVEALHREDIRTPIYISVQCDEFAANNHPEWVGRNPDLTQIKAPSDSVFKPAWQILDMSSPYQDYLAEQTVEILKKFKPVDGIFFDMCWDQPTVTRWALAGMKQAGLDPQSEADRNKYASHVSLAYMKRFSQLVKRYAPRASVYFNSRALTGLPADTAYMTHVEIEALATGGWGYMYFPKNVRYARNFNRPWMGMTSRFHKGWADFGGLKPHAALQFEVSQMLAHGAQCSVGDQLHPRGYLDPAAYKLIGGVYEYAEACEPWTQGATPVTQIGVLRTAAVGYHDPAGGPLDGVTRVLSQLKHQSDLIETDGDFNRYDLLVLPDEVAVDAALAKRLRAYVKRGGKLLITGKPPTELLKDCGVKLLGESPFTTTYFRMDGTDHVMYERGWRVKGANVLARVVEPYFERAYDRFCSHFQTPYRPTPSPYAAAVRKGNIITIPYPIFKAYGTHGNVAYRTFVQKCLDLLLPDRLIEVTAPSTTEVTVMQQRKRTIVHLLQFVAERRTPTLDIIEDIVPIYNVPLTLRLAQKPKKAYLAPSMEKLSFDYADGKLETIVTEIPGHQMVVFE